MNGKHKIQNDDRILCCRRKTYLYGETNFVLHYEIYDDYIILRTRKVITIAAGPTYEIGCCEIVRPESCMQYEVRGSALLRTRCR